MGHTSFHQEPFPITGRRVQALHGPNTLELESGGQLTDVSLAYEEWGQPNTERTNSVLLLHGFSGDSHAAGPAGPAHPWPGWWDALIGPGRAIDTDRYHVICPNALGGCHGSTGPVSLAPDGRPFGSRFPAITIRDLVAAEQRWADALGIQRWHAVMGGSLGGMRALEWAISSPQRVARLVVLATTAACSAENRAFHSVQLRAIALDPAFRGGDYYGAPNEGPVRGLALARSIGRLTYGCERELNRRFNAGSTPDIETYLEDDGEMWSRRFDANSYILLTNAMGSHDVGRGRGGVSEALSRIEARTRVVSISSDRLFPPHQQLQLVQQLRCGVTYTTLESDLGHDAFLSEHHKLDLLIRQSLG